MKDLMSSSLALLPLSAIESLLKMFNSQDPELNFPGVSRAALQSQLDLIQSRNEAVAQAEAALAHARDELAIAGEEVLQLAKKTHAYLSVYAQEDPELQEELAKVKLSEPAGKSGRKKKAPVNTRKSASQGQSQISDTSRKQEASEDLTHETDRAIADDSIEQVALEGVLAAE